MFPKLLFYMEMHLQAGKMEWGKYLQKNHHCDGMPLNIRRDYNELETKRNQQIKNNLQGFRLIFDQTFFLSL
jgi:hypothetical protein